jgi:hypothetical protein
MGSRPGDYVINMRKSKISALLLFLSLSTAVLPQPAQEPISLSTSRGLRLKILRDTNMPFYHAQLIIYYKDDITNPALPYITMLNLLDRDLNKLDSPILDNLRKMGNDYEVEHRPDFLVIKINFTPENLKYFTRFLRELYTYQPFSEPITEYRPLTDLKKAAILRYVFNESITNYWKYFFKKEEWKKTIAYQIAYQHFIPSGKLGRTFITPKAVKSTTFEQVCSFYRNTYQVYNSQLIIKGNIGNPYLIFGTLEMEFNSFKKHPPQVDAEEESNLSINHEKKIIVFDTDDNEPPVMYRFEAIPTSNKIIPLLPLVLNNVLFSYPTGRLFISAGKQNMGYIKIETENVNHKSVTMICNTIHLRYKDIEPFIQLMEREKKRLKINRVDRQELNFTMNGMLGRLKVNTQKYDNDVVVASMNAPAQIPQVTPAALNETIEENEQAVIIIVGKAQLVLASLGNLKRQVEVIDFTQ